MTEQSLLTESIRRVFSDHYTSQRLREAKANGWSEPLWRALEETGMTLVSVPEEAGGGGDFAEGVEAVRLAGKYCAPVPFAETAFLGGWALAKGGLAIPSGPLSFAVSPDAGDVQLSQHRGRWRVSGKLHDVAWARVATALVLVLPYGERCCVLRIPREHYDTVPAENLAHESRDDVHLSAELDTAAVSPDAGVTADQAWLRGALSRSLLISGALERILELTVTYTKQRAQFGRAIIKFQAVQQELARLAGEAAIAKAAALTAAARLESGEAEFYVAAAKVRSGEAAYAGASIAHQLHGAIGVTDEYLLHHSTLRLWSWRTEYGSEADWAQRLGRYALQLGASPLWSRITNA